MPRTTPRIALLFLLLALLAPRAHAQATTPVFLPDSQRAAEALPRALELSSSELYDEASRVLVELMRTDADLLLPRAGSPSVHVPVRGLIHDALLARPALLARYRELYEGEARALLEAGETARVEREHLLTTAGLDAALALARAHAAEAHFFAAHRALAQLDDHPDRAGDRGREALRTLASVRAYLRALDREDNLSAYERSLYDAWSAEAVDDPLARTRVEVPALPPVRTAFSDAGPVRIDGVLSQPLSSRETGTLPAAVAEIARQRGERLPPAARLLHSAPVVVGDTVYANTTETITAWDRFTGRELWSTPVLAPPPAQSRRFRAETEFKELATLVADDATLVALTGVPSAPFAPERTLVALDPRTGSVLWSVALSDGLDDELAGARFAGPPVLVEGVAILVAIDNDPAKRTLVHRLVGYDVRTGERLWNTPVASTGLRQYSESFTPSDGIASVAGDVVHSSTVGAITRVEARTGRVVWTREEPVAERARVGSPPAPWRFQVPALTPDRLFVLAPDRRWVLGLDPDTGERTGRSRASNWDDPHTLTLVGDTLVGVAQRRVVLAPADRLDDASDVRAIVNVSGPDGLGIRGRVVRSGPRLFFPVTTGLVALEVPQPDEAWLAGTPAIPAGELIPLDFPGNTLALEGQLIVADDARVHSYFAWDVAREMLLERETAAPADPVPAVTYAQLAYRAGEVDDIAPALDRAVDALASDPLRPSFDALRRAIFDAVLSMARPDRDPSRLASLTPSMRRDLLDRLAQLARTPDERVASLMTAGAYFEAIGDAPRAIARYQRLLASPALRERQHDTAGLRANAGDEASRRLVSLVAFGGRKVYAPYDRAADARIDALRDDAPVEDLRAIALEFPLARRTPSLYMRIGELHEERGEERAAIEAYETGLRRLLQGESRALASELAGRAVIGSALAGRPTAARLRLREAGAFLGDAGLTYRGRALDGLALAARLRELERDEQQRPRIARTIEPDPAVLPGLRVQRPILRVGARTPTDAVILSRAGGDALEVHVVDDAGELVRTPVDLKGHDPLYLDDDAIFTTTLPRDTKGRRVFHRTDIRTGREQWSTPPFEDLWDPDLNPGFAPPPGAIAPDPSLLDNPISRELLVCFSEDVLLLVERTGRVVGVDARTGAPLWARRLPMVRVVDAHADGGVLAAVGLRRRTLQELARARNEPPIVEERLAAIDVRTGAMLHDPALDARVQWVRVTPAGDAIVGAEGLVQRHDLRSGRLVTTLPVDDLPQSEGVAHVPGRVFVLSPFGPLIAIDTDSGRLSWQRVDTGGRIVNRGGHFEAHPIGDRVYLASRLGFCAIDENSVLVTADARSEGDVTLIPAFTDDSVVTVDARGEGIPSRGLSTYRLALRDLATARLTQRPLRFTIPNAPDALHVLDGHVLVSAGASTLVFRAPPASGLARPAREAFDLESVYARPDGPVPTIAPTPAPTAPQDEEL